MPQMAPAFWAPIFILIIWLHMCLESIMYFYPAYLNPFKQTLTSGPNLLTWLW